MDWNVVIWRLVFPCSRATYWDSKQQEAAPQFAETNGQGVRSVSTNFGKWGSEGFVALQCNLLLEAGPSALAVTKTKLRSRLQPDRDFRCSFSIHGRGLKKFQSIWKIKIYINIPITVVIMYRDSHIFFSKIIVYCQLIVTIFL